MNSAVNLVALVTAVGMEIKAELEKVNVSVFVAIRDKIVVLTSLVGVTALLAASTAIFWQPLTNGFKL
jgi:hypothetical protein